MDDQVMSSNDPNDDPPARNPDKSMQLRNGKILTDIKRIKKMRKKKPRQDPHEDETDTEDNDTTPDLYNTPRTPDLYNTPRTSFKNKIYWDQLKKEDNDLRKVALSNIPNYDGNRDPTKIRDFLA
jgi:hypothetical protein